MRIIRLGSIAVMALIVSACSCETLERAGFQPARLSIKDTPPAKRPHIARAAAMTIMSAHADMSSLRRFCGERHVRFQAGTLKESPEQRARNNAMCQKVYDPK